MRTIRDPRRPALWTLSLLAILFLLAGCPSKPAPSGVRFPITSGSHAALPSTHERIVVWADSALATLGQEWLRSHHYSSILVPDSTGLQAPQPDHRSSDRHAALAVANDMHAEWVLLLEQEQSKNGALVQPDCGRLFSVRVNVVGISVASGQAALRGSAYYPHCVEPTDKTFRSLTCQALATAWGFRPSGQLEIPSHLMCTVGQTEPLPVH